MYQIISSTETAMIIYDQIDGQEYEKSSNMLDLRYCIPCLYGHSSDVTPLSLASSQMTCSLIRLHVSLPLSSPQQNPTSRQCINESAMSL